MVVIDSQQGARPAGHSGFNLMSKINDQNYNHKTIYCHLLDFSTCMIVVLYYIYTIILHVLPLYVKVYITLLDIAKESMFSLQVSL